MCSSQWMLLSIATHSILLVRLKFKASSLKLWGWEEKIENDWKIIKCEGGMAMHLVQVFQNSLPSLSKISCLSNVMLMAHNCSQKYLLYRLLFLSKDWTWDLHRKPCIHLQDDCLRSGHGLWPWNGAKPIRLYVDQACDLDLISTVVGSARLTSPRWLSLMLYFVYKDPKAHSGQSKCLNWALFNVWFDANKLGVFYFFLEFFGRMASFTLDLLKSNTSFELCPLLSSVMREAIKCHILTSLVLASLTSHCGGSKVLPRGH